MECEDLNESIERAYIRIKDLFEVTDKILICDFPSHTSTIPKGYSILILICCHFVSKIYLED